MMESSLRRSIRQTLERGRAMLREQMRLLGVDPAQRIGISSASASDDFYFTASLWIFSTICARERARLSTVSAGLDHLNPLSILSRGYSITKTYPAGAVIKDAGMVHTGGICSVRGCTRERSCQEWNGPDA